MGGSFINARFISQALPLLYKSKRVDSMRTFSTSQHRMILVLLPSSYNPVKVRFFYVCYECSSNISIGNSPHDFSKLNAQVRVIPVLPSPSPIPLHRLSPSHSNIRTSAPDTDSHLPTPIYNTSFLLSVTPKLDLLTTHNLKQNAPAFGDALTLLRVWANQRGYGEGERLCVKGFEGKGGWWASIIALLVIGEESEAGKKGKSRRPVGTGLSSYQMFRAALDFLGMLQFVG
jgi:U3 small nucleolar RNA-associated protein 22